MPRVSIRTGILGTDGKEIVLHEYLCDWPGCANVAEQVIGVVVELRAMAIVCAEHAEHMRAQRPDNDAG